jgi:cytochrome c553
MNFNNSVLSLTLLLAFSGCSDSKPANTIVEEKQETKITAAPKMKIKKNYSLYQIYNSMCIECHSFDGSGNPDKLTPSINKLSQQEMYQSLKDIENDKGHIIMEHNRGEI